MAGITLDFSSVPSREVLEEGTYELVIKKAEEKMSSTGKPMVVILFEEPNTKTGIFENYVLTPDALWKMKELCKAIGLDTEGVQNLELETLVGQTVMGKVVQREYNGDISNSVKKIFPA